MLKRLWLLIVGLWAAVFLWNGSTRLNGVLPGDVALALAPLIIGWLLVLAARFVVTGTVAKTPQAVPWRRS